MGPPRGSHTALRTAHALCRYGSGRDPQPGMVLADVMQPGSDHPGSNPVPGQAINDRSALYELVDVEPLKKGAPNFIVRFTEDKNSFYIHGRKFEPAAGPTTSARIGTYQHWRLSANPPNRILSAYTRSTSLLMRKTVSRSRILRGWIDQCSMAPLWMSSWTSPPRSPWGMPAFHCHLLN